MCLYCYFNYFVSHYCFQILFLQKHRVHLILDCASFDTIVFQWKVIKIEALTEKCFFNFALFCSVQFKNHFTIYSHIHKTFTGTTYKLIVKKLYGAKFNKSNLTHVLTSEACSWHEIWNLFIARRRCLQSWSTALSRCSAIWNLRQSVSTSEQSIS